MTYDKKRTIILGFMKEQMLAVLSTIGERNPESAVVAFGETENLQLFFGTSNDARKYRNLKSNPNVSFVIGWDENVQITIQYEGVANELAGDDIKKYISIFALKNPKTVKFASRKDQRYFLVTPTWVRYSSQEGTFEIPF